MTTNTTTNTTTMLVIQKEIITPTLENGQPAQSLEWSDVDGKQFFPSEEVKARAMIESWMGFFPSMHFRLIKRKTMITETELVDAPASDDGE